MRRALYFWRAVLRQPLHRFAATIGSDVAALELAQADEQTPRSSLLSVCECVRVCQRVRTHTHAGTCPLQRYLLLGSLFTTFSITPVP